MHGHFDGSVRQAQEGVQLGVRCLLVVFDRSQATLERVEQVQPAPGLVFVPQPGDAAIEDGDSPSPLEDPFRCRIVRRLPRVALLAVLEVE